MNEDLHDLVADLLNELRLSGTVFLQAEFSEPWSIAAGVAAEDCTPYIPVPNHLIAYHYIVEGDLWVATEATEPVQAKAGQLLLLPRNDQHILASHPQSTPTDIAPYIVPGEGTGPASISYGGGGRKTQILCGYLGTEHAEHPLLTRLPDLLRMELDSAETGRWVEETIRHSIRRLVAQKGSAARSLYRLAELLLAEAISAYLEEMPGDQQGWLLGLRDPIVNRALRILHQRSSQITTLTELADLSSTSRSVLTEKFRTIVGVPPMEYQRRLRLQQAAEKLERTKLPISTIGYDTGYGSEAAFSRSFKRSYGVSPGLYRSQSENPVDA